MVAQQYAAQPTVGSHFGSAQLGWRTMACKPVATATQRVFSFVSENSRPVSVSYDGFHLMAFSEQNASMEDGMEPSVFHVSMRS